MVYNEKLANRIRKMLATQKGLTEKKMFGGISFMVNGNMCCGILKNSLVVRIGPKKYEKALTEPNVRPMDLTGRPLKGIIYVDPDGYRKEEDLAKWVKQGIDFALSLPPK